ncbi:protein-export chaperone SecB [Aurantiacibacter poecillastricola]|uniref:protein-export chaperone SecB n=1 Tax=Aurantiacibacter poecillastricola TaxID=3064385 RepID=UPI00273FFB4D|nr:protein-export chaperone SecB [Aurantiacibacter sp. 219JJ12-13]MDP5261052.1 protein-export chaperone SecB [Aurantiacibacter sp. 219JJ12-13]
MADEGDVLKNLDNQPQPAGGDNAPVAGLISQYVKDLSVENPNAPASYRWQDQPKMDVQFNIGAQGVSDDVSEVELKITVSAKMEQGTAYIIDLAYAGLIGIRNMPEQQAHAFLYAEAPRLLFPFARRVVSDAIRDAGFAPLMLDPIDFNGLYVQRMQQRRADEGQGQQGAAAPAPGGEG